MRTLCASTLIGEFFVIGFAGLVAMQLSDLPTATIWTVSGVAMLLSVLLCGMLTRPGGVQLGWALQTAPDRQRLRRADDVLPGRGLRGPVVGVGPLRPQDRRGEGPWAAQRRSAGAPRPRLPARGRRRGARRVGRAACAL